MVFLAEKAEHRTMEELLKKIAEHFGYAAPFAYATLAFGLFYWADKKLSAGAKDLLARTMRLKDYKKEQIASALVEFFDRIYTYPLLRWRAFFRSFLFATIISVFWVFERGPIDQLFAQSRPGIYNLGGRVTLLALAGLLFNAFSDYLCLFVIRPLLIRSGTKPVIGLALGAVSGAVIVVVGHNLRAIVMSIARYEIADFPVLFIPFRDLFFLADYYFNVYVDFVLPALAVFAWLPLFALGIVIVRLLTPLSKIVGGTQWILEGGKEHPLEAIGYVAAVVVFLGTIAVQAVFSA
jgi:hypothetical protein